MEYEPLTRELWVCRVCRRPLDLFQQHEGDLVVDYRWQHPSQDDPGHEPDPVRAEDTGGEVVGSCDFCGVPGPAFRHECADFQATGVHGSVGDWAACKTCQRLVLAGQWEQLGNRAMKQQGDVPPALRKYVRGQIRLVHAGFRRSRTGVWHQL